MKCPECKEENKEIKETDDLWELNINNKIVKVLHCEKCIEETKRDVHNYNNRK